MLVCPNPPNPSNSIPNTPLDGTYFTGSQIVYTCINFYEFPSGEPSSVTCQNSGQWLPSTLVSCERMCKCI